MWITSVKQLCVVVEVFKKTEVCVRVGFRIGSRIAISRESR